VTGDLYVPNDFGVIEARDWRHELDGRRHRTALVEVSGLSIAPSARKLVAATHGRSAWTLTLP